MKVFASRDNLPDLTTLEAVRCFVSYRGHGDNQPRVHGNGFIQLDLTPRSRLHVWGHPYIPRQKVATPIHDHIFSFTSYVLWGRLINVVYAENAPYTVVTQGLPTGRFFEPHVREQGSGSEDQVLWARDQSSHSLSVKDVQIVNAGESYQLNHGVLHESIAPEIAVSVIQKSGPTMGQGAVARPRVFVPEGLEPDNEFNRYTAASRELLWEIISLALSAEEA